MILRIYGAGGEKRRDGEFCPLSFAAKKRAKEKE
jgi:hypothetical protein